MAHFNVWDFISVPLLYTTRSHPDPTNHAEAVEDLHAMLPCLLYTSPSPRD